MGRRRKGRDVSGWVVIDKPAGIGSTQVVNKVRWAFEAKKAGHAGTLDPDATGILAVALGEATKTVSLLTDALKAYEFGIAFGAATTTDDASGEIIATSDVRPSDAAVADALPAFVGEIEQVPPQVSAVKVEGERAYDLAREGVEMELAARPLHVESLDLLGRPDPDRAILRLVCGKGGYVRSIARDLGEALGTRAHVTHLRRMWSGPFTLDDAVRFETIDELARTPAIDELLLGIEAGLGHVPVAQVAGMSVSKLANGNPVEVLRTDADFGDTVWAMHDGRALAIGTYRAGMIHPSRVLNRPA
ncbi:tRNA pseudouridine(55) synthase TruB [Palleronia sp. LCG004]|uniref:tRNA pseudouridine(55) synthase TruB n=1 Tax=Palleronia sp. LCG004 TaxID=3079304 RepID=UPI002941D89D|nr:tRNA pseudouridine(55) synthase TruB [Palleronia sp. LCG004]WOI55447.1 tRNA pseudouridine(55) synthase TruB [Palleronia sp. LCG004]